MPVRISGWLALILVCTITVALTGCNKLDINIQIQKDGSAQTKFSIPPSTQQKDLPFAKEIFATMKKAGYMITGNAEEGFTVIGKGINEIQRLTEKMPELPGFPALGGAYGYHSERSFWSTTYAMDWVFPWEQEQKSKLFGIAVPNEITFSVHLPVKPKSHNAMSVNQDGSTLYWHFTERGPKEIHFLARRINWESILFSVTLIFGISLLLMVKIIKLRNYIYKCKVRDKKY